ncbi:hypothetical protein [Mycetohabitans sp. B46]|uniref:hypothetical protein n=1 Tax=Mycetohabitans sp. B46 TaxID=2772536 RepID=UPI00307CED62
MQYSASGTLRPSPHQCSGPFEIVLLQRCNDLQMFGTRRHMSQTMAVLWMLGQPAHLMLLLNHLQHKAAIRKTRDGLVQRDAHRLLCLIFDHRYMSMARAYRNYFVRK